MPQALIDLEVRLLMEAIYTRYNHDFREYSGASQKRRVLHAVQQLGCESISDLQGRVLRDPLTFAQLLEILTVPFTEMFREPEFFLALRQQVMPVLHTYPSLKIWVAGCASGEEVYSLAILLHEEQLLERSIIYATDINPAALERARQGIFPLADLQLYTRNYQAAGGTNGFSDYYTAAYGAARFDRELSRRVTFADHSLATDHVFSETQLICCRNVLIYFNRSLQDRAIGLFAQSLCHRGFLGLGSKESLDFSAHGVAFEPVAQRERLFRKR
ncbi:CheR family methyltransferase [Roseateles cellulosilyticus]|uniref:Protein-glutamate O-methyltransferase CheR n=1 Tax=Pelomonas cellulosilytica TaxID=2906762 RepID=A0ABS8Y079_9BURK|nr:protein-glutamate O-methyltransferase CheR [Pelomonas sp. P8]MCE4556930.1 protein-glutamate O-methyltransferase CheR [Pelomonas sp. P8]